MATAQTNPLATASESGTLRLPFWPIFLLALILRLAYLFDAQQLAFFHHPIGDAKAYDDWAWRIAQGQWFGPTTFYQAPLYPYVLAVLYKLLGHNVWWPRLFQCITSSLACALLAGAASRWSSPRFGRRAAWITGIAASLYAPSIFFDGLIQKASLALFLVAVLIRLLASQPDRRLLRRGFFVGLTAGSLSLTRENALVLIPLLIAWLFWRARIGSTGLSDDEPAARHTTTARDAPAARDAPTARSPWRPWLAGLSCLAGTAVALSPAVIHNRAVGGEWTLTTFQLGPNFYMGNHQGVQGWMGPIVPGRETPEFERADATRLAEQAVGRKLTAAEVSRYWLERSLDYIRNRPVDWLGLLGRKWWLVWNDYEIPDTESYELYRAHSRILTVFGWFVRFGTICPLAMVAFFFSRERVRSWLILPGLAVAMAAAVALFFVSARYRFPIVPFLLVMVGIGWSDAWAALRRDAPRQVKRWAWAVLVLLVAAIWCYWPVAQRDQLEAGQWGNLGAALAQRSRLDEALPCFERAERMFPEAPRLRAFLADALSIKGRYAEAIPHYRALLAIQPDRPGAHFNYAVALERTGRFDEAIEQYRLALVIDPNDAEARAALDRLASRALTPQRPKPHP